MGVTGLWEFLREKGVLLPTKLEDLRGSVAAVDLSCWIYPILFSLGSSIDTSTLNAEILERINRLTKAGIQAVIVFDGLRPPAKDETAAKRNHNYKRVNRAVFSVPTLCKIFRKLNIPFVVSPYEADVQMVALEREGLVNLVLTLDSDLILHGCKRILFRMNRDGGGMLYQQVELTREVLGATLVLDRLRWCALLIGSDYNPGGVKGIGRKNAMRIYRRTRRITDLEAFLDSVEKLLDLKAPFRQRFMLAELTFRHQVIFDVKDKVLKHLSPPPPAAVMPYAGSLDILPGECFIDPAKLNGSSLPELAHNHFKCPICVGVAFDTREERRNHWVKVHGRDRRPFKCTSCNAAFPTHYSLRRHLKSHAGIKPFPCNVCGIGFRDLDRVRTHMASHKLGEKTFPCEQCGKVFLYRSSLFTHKQAHANLRKFQCGECNRSFAFLSYLQKHAAVHTKEQKFACPHCSQRFTQVGSRNTHVKTKHTKQEPWKCDRCPKEYASKKSLLRHQRKVHP